MTTEKIRYWFNKETRIVHKTSCPNCLMSYAGNMKQSSADWGVRENWWGPYATKGAAVDAGLTIGAAVYECAKGCGPNQINPK